MQKITWWVRGGRPPRLRQLGLSSIILLLGTVGCASGGRDVTDPIVPPPVPAPVATSVSPDSFVMGSDGATVVVGGSGFTSRTVGRWNGSDRPTTVQSATQLQLAVTAADLAAAGTASITIATPAPGGGTSGPLSVSIQHPTPLTTAVSPSVVVAGSAGAEIVVTGSGFVSASRLHWNGDERATTIVNATTLNATVSEEDVATAGSATVRVVTPAPGGGTSAPLTVAINNREPLLESVSPATIAAGAGAVTLTLTGTGFGEVSRVRWNGEERPTTLVASTTLTATLVALDVAAAGTAQVSVINPEPGGGTSRAVSVVIEPPALPAPSLASISPNGAFAGAGALTVTLTGTSFAPSSVARWNGAPRPTTVVNATNLTMAVSASDLAVAGTANITVSTASPGGGTSEAREFTIAAQRMINAQQRVSAGNFTTCAIDGADRVRCWGRADQGLIGDGQFGAVRLEPSVAAGGTTFKSIVTTGSQSCGISSANVLLCWGPFTTNLSNPSNLATAVIVPVAEAPVSLSIQQNTSCVLTVSQSIWCRGSFNSFGMLGNGTLATTGNFTKVVGDITFAAVSVGSTHVCALNVEGIAYCWGVGSAVGRSGAPTNNPMPMPVNSAERFVRLSAGNSQSCALTAVGVAWCWGVGARDPVQVVGNHQFADIAVGNGTTCAVDTAGAAWCWGGGQYGISGRADEGHSLAPVRVASPSGVSFTDISVGQWHTCARDTANVPWCWGREYFGALGNGRVHYVDSPELLVGTSGFIDVDASGSRTCALHQTGSVSCWGTYAAGTSGVTSAPQPTLVQSSQSFVSITTGSSHSCAREADGRAWCWGLGSSGRLGHGSSVSSMTPVSVGDGKLFTSISAGGSRTCGITGMGTFCWGSGRLGDGTNTSSPIPVAVTGSAGFTAVSNGSSHACALNASGQALCWGADQHGALGVGTRGERLLPTATLTDERFSSIHAGHGFTCALTSAGRSFCWGINIGGRRGFATGVPQDPGLSPTATPGNHTWRQIGKGGSVHNCGIMTSGQLSCWGFNTTGQVGVPWFNGYVPFASVQNSGGFTKVTVGTDHNCALGSGGAIYCWGELERGSIGNGRMGHQHVPVRATPFH